MPDNPDTYFARDARGAREELFAREAREEIWRAKRAKKSFWFFMIGNGKIRARNHKKNIAKTIISW